MYIITITNDSVIFKARRCCRLNVSVSPKITCCVLKPVLMGCYLVVGPLKGDKVRVCSLPE